MVKGIHAGTSFKYYTPDSQNRSTLGLSHDVWRAWHGARRPLFRFFFLASNANAITKPSTVPVIIRLVMHGMV